MNSISTKELLKILPHRYPFLMIDRVVDYDDDTLVALKNFTVNEPYVQGHFPQMHIMPGVMMMEAMAQACTVLAYKRASKYFDIDRVIELAGENSGILFVNADEVRVRKVILPGDQLFVHAKLIRYARNLADFETHIKVDDKIVASSKLKAVFRMGNGFTRSTIEETVL